MTDGPILARMVHVLAIVIWIGGVALITTIILPLAKSLDDPQQASHLFESVERRFSWIARTMVAVAGASGFYMVRALNLWSRFADLHFWWMYAMVAVWAIFAVILFAAEPLLHRQVAEEIARQPQRAFRRMIVMHWILLAASALTIMGAVMGTHGYSLFD